MSLDKVVPSAADAVVDVPSRASVVSHSCGVDGAGLGLLLERRRISRVIAS